MSDKRHTPDMRSQSEATKRPYGPPSIERVDLALAETLSAGCKLAGTCDEEFDPVSEAGS